MRPRTLRTAIAVVTAGLTLTACGSDDGGLARGRRVRHGRRHRDLGRGLRRDGRPRRGRAGGGHAQRDRAAPGLGQLRRDDRGVQREVRHRDQQRDPDGSSQDELNAVDEPAGQDRAPDVLDLGTRSPARRRPRASSRPTRWPTWDEIPEDQKDPEGHWYNDYGGYISIGCNASVIDECPTSFADLLDPQYAGQVALNGNPTQAAAAFAGVWAASLANGGDLDDIGPGIDFFARLKEAGNFNPVEITPATIERARRRSSSTGTTSTPGSPRPSPSEGVEWQVARPLRRALRQLLQPGDQQVRPAPGGCPALAGVPLQRRGPEHLARGRRPPGPAAGHGGGRHRRQGGARGSAAVAGTAEFPTAGAGDRRPAGRGGALERGDLRLSTPAADDRRAGPSQEGPARRRLASLGALPFFLFVAIFLLLPIGVLAVEAFRATDPVTFEESWSTAIDRGDHRGRLPPRLLGSLQLSAITAVLGAVLGLALAFAVAARPARRLLRRLVLTAAGVLANFGGVPLAFAFIATIGTAGVVTALLTDTLGLGLGGFSLYSLAGLALVYLYFLIPLMVLTIMPALEALRPQWREAAGQPRRDRLAVLAARRRAGPRPAGASARPMLLFACAFAAYATAKALVGSSIPLVTLQIADALSSNVVVGSENLRQGAGARHGRARRPGDDLLRLGAAPHAAVAGMTALSTAGAGAGASRRTTAGPPGRRGARGLAVRRPRRPGLVLPRPDRRLGRGSPSARPDGAHRRPTPRSRAPRGSPRRSPGPWRISGAHRRHRPGAHGADRRAGRPAAAPAADDGRDPHAPAAGAPADRAGRRRAQRARVGAGLLPRTPRWPRPSSPSRSRRCPGSWCWSTSSWRCRSSSARSTPGCAART